MCLTTRLKKPFVAKKDIVCYKYLIQCYDGCYHTPYRNVKINLGEKMVADTKRSYEGENWNNYHKHAITDGFIHTTLEKEVMGNVVVKAIIPTGTEFYISDDCTEICARELILTNELIEPSDIPNAKIAIRELFTDYFEGFFNPTKVDVGYYRLADGSYVSPTNLTEDIKEEIIGVVACIHDNKVHVVSLDDISLPWCSNRFGKGCFMCRKQYIDCISPENDFDGEGNTKDVFSHNTYCSERYPAFAWIADYHTKGTKKGDWHMGACGEVIAIGRYNQLKINIALALLDSSRLIDYRWLWSSSERIGNVWYIDPSFGTITTSHGEDNMTVRAFITFDV